MGHNPKLVVVDVIFELQEDVCMNEHVQAGGTTLVIGPSWVLQVIGVIGEPPPP